ncbi:hypothetical protein CCHOA_08735 [Corynebacterium choanae]|uniref:Uncharacterized protein n=1 Tax=Corynebacterium choanae TaxID=1862358 RepID=A0A3G6J7Q2_9CORY|nr:hypothetical protein CCHOA_08735 [Corynebacterium choanae]
MLTRMTLSGLFATIDGERPFLVKETTGHVVGCEPLLRNQHISCVGDGLLGLGAHHALPHHVGSEY